MKAPQTTTTTRTLVPQGTHIAICYQMVEMGTQRGEYKGQVSENYKVRISWELPYEKMEDGKPMVISKEYTFFMGDKSNLRKDIQAWRGADFTNEQAAEFDLEVLLGKPCQVTVVHKTALSSGKVRDEVVSIAGISKGMTVPKQENKNKLLSFENWDQEVFESLPEFIRTKVTESPEYAAMKKSEEIAEFPPKQGESKESTSEEGPGPEFFQPTTDLEKEVAGTQNEPLF